MSLLDSNHFSPPHSGALDIDDVAFLKYFETYLADIIGTLDNPVRDLAEQVVLAGGKRIRPLLVFKSGSVLNGVTEDLLKASAILELVHVATLVHDDILDNAKIRRSNATIHTQVGEHNAILLGDALFSFALELATDFSSTRICRIVSSATRRTCSGEIMQTFSRGNFDITLSDYFSFIQDKTGELFKASCQSGAFLAGHSEHVIEMVGDFGLSLGVNYQIFDDIVDTFGSSSAFGKCLGTDFDTGKVTLPMILLLQKLKPDKKRDILSVLKSGSSIEQSRHDIGELMYHFEIQEECLNFLRRKFNKTRLLATNLTDQDTSRNLLNFLTSFDDKLSLLSLESMPNILALDK
mgnify:CR=1 FL=1